MAENLKFVKANDNLLDMRQASEYLNIKISTLYAMCMRRQILFVKLGRLNRFRKCDLDKFIESNLREAIHDRPVSFG
jgi:excisionase family DNA binding protein